MASVPVKRYLKVPLKSHKEEFYSTGMVDENCSISLFPQYAASAWNAPCWWLERHRIQWKSVSFQA
jgi:hypothetical protein